MSDVPHVYQPITHGMVWYQPITHNSHTTSTPSLLPASGIAAAQQGAVHKAIPACNMSDSTSSKQGKLQATPLPCLPSTKGGHTPRRRRRRARRYCPFLSLRLQVVLHATLSRPFLSAQRVTWEALVRADCEGLECVDPWQCLGRVAWRTTCSRKLRNGQ